MVVACHRRGIAARAHCWRKTAENEQLPVLKMFQQRYASVTRKDEVGLTGSQSSYQARGMGVSCFVIILVVLFQGLTVRDHDMDRSEYIVARIPELRICHAFPVDVDAYINDIRTGEVVHGYDICIPLHLLIFCVPG